MRNKKLIALFASFMLALTGIIFAKEIKQLYTYKIPGENAGSVDVTEHERNIRIDCLKAGKLVCQLTFDGNFASCTLAADKVGDSVKSATITRNKDNKIVSTFSTDTPGKLVMLIDKDGDGLPDIEAIKNGEAEAQKFALKFDKELLKGRQ